MIVGVVLLVVFVWLESRVAHPLLPLRLVLDPDPRWFVHGGVRPGHGDVLDLPVS
ncbi:hypothetical protein RM704_36015 [Streptomyces sp. DSM 3412]|uniref:Uncharacterized protein n=1 Tax=Streptomyces gottesmaniae TaxID=3075518 RepID=A0ABU2Z956_9ACTN|nr:hypothetical protein [Streptomyces sp. DSM 3412]MDT0572809.1 hypothetical protein [Streptomyces sp. DSM 3412]